MKSETEILMELLERGISPTQAVEECARRLLEAGFTQLSYSDEWDLKPGGRYCLIHHDTTLFAFVLGSDWKSGGSPQVRLAAAHTDFPCLRIKPSADVAASGYAQVNVEVYGGAILNTWLDRPLGVAGRVAVRGESPFAPRLCRFAPEKNLMTIPNLAIHMNREVNKGVELNKQTDMLPILGLSGEESEVFLSFLAGELSVKKEDILDYELTVYCREMPTCLGVHDEFLSSPRLDNLTSCSALISAVIGARRQSGINLVALFDHEEIGSRTKQGAGSMLMSGLLRRILMEMGRGSTIERDLYDGMLLSVDVAHGMHPNQAGRMDITNKPVLGGGVCIKEASAQTYATDCEAIAIVQQLCEEYEVKYQKFVNRSDQPGGGTLGAVASALLPVRTVDIGVPLLAMHSARELMGTSDQRQLKDLVEAFFSCE